MVGLKLEVSRFVEEAQPNVVECIFIDSHGKKHSIIERCQLLVPTTGVIACQVVQRRKSKAK
jgi:hypothetical protein